MALVAKVYVRRPDRASVATAMLITSRLGCSPLGGTEPGPATGMITHNWSHIKSNAYQFSLNSILA